MPPTGDPLTRHYRRLLLCYPRSYRRDRGEEILGLLLDTAPAGRIRPTLREALDVVRNGLRCRLGRPTSRTVGVWAVLTAVICGLFTAAATSRVAWETSRPQPDRAEAAAIFADALPGRSLGEIETAPALFVFYGQPFRWQGLDAMLFGDGGEYQPGFASASATGLPPVPVEQTLAVTRQHLGANGWRIYETVSRADRECVSACDPPVALTDTTLVASRGDTVFRMTLFAEGGPTPTNAALEVQRAAPPAVVPAAVLAGLVGGVLAWLVFGWASRRTEYRPGVTILFGITMFLWWLPVLLATPSLIGHQRAEPHPDWHPLWEWLGQPTASLFFVIGAVCALIVLGCAAVPRRDTAPLRTIATG